MKIFLVGFMGAGKTTIGRELARRLGFPFFDLDELVESAEQLSVKGIFAEKGEPFFRQRERELLLATRYVAYGVIATGGGTFCFEENVEYIRTNGLSIHLSAPFDLLVSRVSAKAAERPLFRDEEATRQLFHQRARFYRMADVTIDVREQETVPEVVERIMMELPKELLAVARPLWKVR